MEKIYRVIRTKFNQSVEENVLMIINKAYLSDIRVTNISKSFAHKMPAETSWRNEITPLSRYVGKGKVFPYSLPSVGPGADPGVQAVSPQVT